MMDKDVYTFEMLWHYTTTIVTKSEQHLALYFFKAMEHEYTYW